MKTTLHISDPLMIRLKQTAAKRGQTMASLVEAALRQYLDTDHEAIAELPPLPRFDSGGAIVNIADRDALYHAMEGR